MLDKITYHLFKNQKKNKKNNEKGPKNDKMNKFKTYGIFLVSKNL